MNNKILTTILILLASKVLYGESEKNVTAHINVPAIQIVSIMNQNNFAELTSLDLNKGYIILEDCIELEIKSNTVWSLYVKEDLNNIGNNLNIYIKDNYSDFVKITTSEVQIRANRPPTSGEIINFDCKRIVNWHTSNPSNWFFTPTFLIKSDIP